MKITFDGRALCGNLTGIGYLTKSLVLPLSKHFEVSLCAHKNFYIPEGFLGNVLIGPNIYGSLWFHTFFPRLQKDDILFCPLNVKPYKTKKKCISIIHDLTPFLFPNWHKLKIRLTTLPFLEDTILNSFIITLSNKIKKEIERYFQKKEIFVIPPGCNFYKGEEKWEREKLENEYFLYLGTIEPRKNLKFLIEFWKENKNLPTLYIAGDKGWKIKLKNIPKNVKIIGYVREEEKYFLIRKCLALIYPSSYEGFGLPVLEAGAEGIPVISTKVPAVEEYKINSLILINLNFKNLKEAIEIILKGKIKREKSSILSWEDVALKYKEVIDWYIKS
jgi:glycosyltransferase involved in cell wall biosynthesis